MSRTWEVLTRSHASLKFAIVGAIGFVIDSAVLILLYEFLKLDLEIARFIAFMCAVTSNWILNRFFTFASRGSTDGKTLEWVKFLSSAILSAIPNLGIFFLLIQVLPETLGFVMFAMCCGILAGYYCNYQLARQWVFKARTE